MQSFLRFARSLQGRAGWHSSRSRGVGALVTYTYRCLAHWRAHAAWLAFLDEPAMADIAAADRTLTERYQHRYLSTALDMGRRLEALHEHYAFAAAHFPPALFDALYCQRETHLGNVTLRDGGHLRLILKAPRVRDREGELSVSLTDDTGLQVSVATFSFVDGGRTILVGCLQGAANNAGRDAVRELTRQCHGLRPKNLLLSVIRALAEGFGVENVLGIGNAAHPFARSNGKIKADYDAFWLEVGGVLADDGFYALPPREPSRCESTVESKRRSEFRRRETLRREVCGLVVAAFGIHQRAAIPLAA